MIEELPATSLNASRRAVLRNAVSSYATLFLGAALGLVSTPLILGALGTLKFGTLAELGAATGYLSLLEIGLGTAATTRIASVEAEDPEALTEVVSATLLLFTCVGVAAIALSGIGCIFVPELFGIPHAIRSDAVVAFLILGCTQSVNSSLTVYTSFLLGTGRMYKLNLLGFAISSIGTIVYVILARAHARLPVLACVGLVSAAVSYVTMRMQTRRDFPTVRPRLRQARRVVIRRLLSLGWRNAISSVAGILAFGSDLVLIGILLSPRAAAAYAIALRGYGFLVRFTTSVVGAVGPSHSHRAATADNEHRFLLFSKSLLITLTLAVGAGIVVASYAHPLLQLWLGRVPNHSSEIVVIFCAVLILQSPGTAASVLLVSSELAGDAMRLTLRSATVNVVASVALTAAVGVIGPALGSLIAVTLFDSIYFPLRACRVLGQSFARLVREAILPLVAPALILLVALAIGRTLAASGPLILLVSSLAGLVYGMALWRTPAVRRLRPRAGAARM